MTAFEHRRQRPFTSFTYLIVILFVSFEAISSSSIGNASLLAPLSKSTSHGPHSYRLPETFPRGASPTKREYSLVVKRGTFAPDGFAKEAYLVNDQMPGPVIEANEGDTLEITVTNTIGDGTSTSMHWHGIRQNGTQVMDGVPGFSQCPLRDGESQTYVFDTKGQSGTFWYHSHSTSQSSDGILGPLIIHPSRSDEAVDRDVTADYVFLIQDWYHDRTEIISEALLSAQGYHGAQVAPAPQSNLINGRGVFACERSGLHRKRKSCTKPKRPFVVVPRARVRFRFINGGPHGEQLVSVDMREMTVIAADGVAIEPQVVHRIPFSNGQRYDVIVDFSQLRPGDGVWLRAEVDKRCFAVQEPSLDPIARMAIYVERISLKPPVTQAWQETLPACKDLDETMLLAAAKPATVTETAAPSAVYFFNSVLGQLRNTNGPALSRFEFNGTTYVDHVNQPFLRTLSQGKNLPTTDVAVVTVADDVWVADIIINNLDTAVTHPYHLHGMEFAIIQRGRGALTYQEYQSQLQSGALSTRLLSNPLRRDTLTIQGNSYAILRLDASVAGVWPLHCHIAWHLTQGFMAAVVIHPHALAENPNKVWTVEAQRQCSDDLAAGASIDEVQPPRRR